MEIKGSITTIKARITASGDTVQSVTLEVFGDITVLHALMKKPLKITITEEN